MQSIHNFGISIKKYAKNSKNNIFPKFEFCPICKKQTIIEYGFYSRTVITFVDCYVIFIKRFRCKSCKVNIFILPSFVFPRKRYCINFIQRCLWLRFFKAKTLFASANPVKSIYCNYQRLQYWIKELSNNLPKLQIVLIKLMKKERLKVLEGIKSSNKIISSSKISIKSLLELIILIRQKIELSSFTKNAILEPINKLIFSTYNFSFL